MRKLKSFELKRATPAYGEIQGPNPLENLIGDTAAHLSKIFPGLDRSHVARALASSPLATAFKQALVSLDESEKKAMIDPRTGIANISGFKQAVRRAIMHMHRHRDIQVAIVALDVDEFKALNDTYGHDAGNRALVEVAVSLKKSIRKADVSAHMSDEEKYKQFPASPHGDEFLVLFTSSLADDRFAQSAADRLEGNLGNVYIMAAPLEGGASGKVFVRTSMGVSSPLRPEHLGRPNVDLSVQRVDALITTLLREADGALYQQKEKKKSNAPAGQDLSRNP